MKHVEKETERDNVHIRTSSIPICTGALPEQVDGTGLRYHFSRRAASHSACRLEAVAVLAIDVVVAVAVAVAAVVVDILQTFFAGE